MTVPEAARVLGIGRDAAYRAAARGELPTLRVGRRILVPVAALERLLGIQNVRVEAAGGTTGHEGVGEGLDER
jgi:excisionase family DNA binding protein